MSERWRPIHGHEVSDRGRVRSVDRVVNGRPIRGQVLRQTVAGGKPYVTLWQGGERMTYAVDELVETAFPTDWANADWNQIRVEWRPLWSDYEVSSDGRVRGRRGLVKILPTEKGRTVRLYKSGRVKTFRVAELIGEAFGEPWDAQPYATGSARLFPSDVREIRRLGAAGVKRQTIADRFGIGRVHACRIISGARWGQLK